MAKNTGNPGKRRSGRADPFPGEMELWQHVSPPLGTPPTFAGQWGKLLGMNRH